MRRDQVAELHYITPIRNVDSIARLGLLSHRRSAHVPHRSVAMTEIQERRAAVTVPGGRPLHDYVNMYLNARNAMLFKRHCQHAELCVLRISPSVLDGDGVIITDGNAASGYVKFRRAHDGLIALDYDRLYAEYWKHPDDPIEEFRHRSLMCAEVLVPDRVGPEMLIGAYVSCEEALRQFRASSVNVVATIDRHVFFLT